MMRFSTVLFNFGDTLLHVEQRVLSQASDNYGLINLTKYLKQYQENIRWNQVRNEFVDPWREQTMKSRPEMMLYQMFQMLGQFLHHHGIELTDEEKLQAVNTFYIQDKVLASYENELLQTLHVLKEMGLKIGAVLYDILSEDIVRLCLHKMRIEESIDFFIAKSRMEMELNQREIPLAETVFVGDNLAEDIKMAKELGMKTIWLNIKQKGNAKLKIRPDYIIQRICDIPGYLITE